MKRFDLRDFIGGWFVGNFDPSIIKTSNFEVAVKSYKAGDSEKRHYHKEATEITVIVRGVVKMNGQVFSDGDVILIDRGESTDFNVMEDTDTIVVKTPSVIGDKYIHDTDLA